jgi:hypothetical protein
LPRLPRTLNRADVSDNLFFGSIPPGFCDNGSLLSDLRLDRNRLSGSATELSNCASLERLSVQGNSFSGDPPFVRKSSDSFCQLSLEGDGNRFSSCSDPTNECCCCSLEIDVFASAMGGGVAACLLLCTLCYCWIYGESLCEGGTARRNETMRRLTWTELSAEDASSARRAGADVNCATCNVVCCQ